jgi:hypothetical protein
VPQIKLPRRNCLYCGKECARSIQKYCSNKCQAAFEHKLRLDNGGFKDPRSIKKLLVKQRGHCCEICHITEWQVQSVPLVMDHTDGNSENNDLDNLRLVCGNCDMQLPTYKARNFGNGRYSRRVRYAKGQSY